MQRKMNWMISTALFLGQSQTRHRPTRRAIVYIWRTPNLHEIRFDQKDMERLVYDQDHLGKMYTEIRRKNMFDSPILIFHYFSLSFWLVIFHSTADS